MSSTLLQDPLTAHCYTAAASATRNTVLLVSLYTSEQGFLAFFSFSSAHVIRLFYQLKKGMLKAAHYYYHHDHHHYYYLAS